MKVDKGKLIINVSSIDKSSYEALACFAEEYSMFPIGELVKQWLDYTAWDVAAWYIGDDL